MVYRLTTAWTGAEFDYENPVLKGNYARLISGLADEVFSLVFPKANLCFSANNAEAEIDNSIPEE